MPRHALASFNERKPLGGSQYLLLQYKWRTRGYVNERLALESDACRTRLMQRGHLSAQVSMVSTDASAMTKSLLIKW